MLLIKRIFGLIPWADNMIENAWRARNWMTFLKLWLIFTVGIAVVTFLLVFVSGTLYLEGMRVHQLVKVRADTAMSISQFMAGQYSGLWNFAVGFTAIAGLGALLTAVPVMLMKQMYGFEPEQ
jgi:hypothetical protein